MKLQRQDIFIRSAVLDDAGELSVLLNEIIAIGGTTAIVGPVSPEEFADYFLQGESHICCFRCGRRGRGTPPVSRLLGATRNCRRTGPISRRLRVTRPKSPGSAPLCLPETRKFVEQSCLTALNATIRADNEGGLKFYGKLGFRTYTVAKQVPLRDGNRIDRISKRSSWGERVRCGE